MNCRSERLCKYLLPEFIDFLFTLPKADWIRKRLPVSYVIQTKSQRFRSMPKYLHSLFYVEKKKNNHWKLEESSSFLAEVCAAVRYKRFYLFE